MTNRWTRIAVWTLALALVTVAAGCRGHRHGLGDDPDALARHVERGLDHLDATDEQRRAIEPVAREMAAEILALRPGAERLRSLAMAEWNAAKPDVAVLHQQLDAELERVRATLHRLVDQAMLVHGSLTPEQREDIASAAARHRRWRR